MKFDNVQAELVLDDKKDLLSIEAKLTFEGGEGSEVNRLIPTYFQGSKGRFIGNNTGVTYTVKIPLTDEGKKILKNLVEALKNLDNAYKSRTTTVNDFMNLVGE